MDLTRVQVAILSYVRENDGIYLTEIFFGITKLGFIIPKILPAVDFLCDQGLITRDYDDDGVMFVYRITEAGKAVLAEATK